MNELINITACRRTGRTTRILKHMLKSKFDTVLYLARNNTMSKYHRDMFLKILDEMKIPYVRRDTEIKVVVLGKRFIFRGEDQDFQSYLIGFPVIDIHRDHTCYE